MTFMFDVLEPQLNHHQKGYDWCPKIISRTMRFMFNVPKSKTVLEISPRVKFDVWYDHIIDFVYVKNYDIFCIIA